MSKCLASEKQQVLELDAAREQLSEAQKKLEGSGAAEHASACALAECQARASSLADDVAALQSQHAAEMGYMQAQRDAATSRWA